ncbi:hypothetical protein I3F58_19040 [Streptomyces sp. MUM 203J]|uniref:hypothetical protein n=1 Tax=Streptomyces sp. MUM 203J TaxID=2791990 RepID=UPI001F03E7A6|nr:hypothetical protein [Streptomyces sp. MUM 203J]MCH0541620.1 hypothetical protein [Streptomyces sp. MUM 203J]
MSGSLWLTPPENSDTLTRIPRPPRPRTGDTPVRPARQAPGWAAADPLDELTERLEDLIAQAVHPDEIAAALESDGMTDDHIRLTYGRENSFALAEDLYARVPRRHPEPAGTSAGPWHTRLGGCVLRGLVFALPGLAYVLGAPLLAGPPGTLGLPAGTMPLLAGALTGWTWNQALSHRAHAWLGLADRPAAARALLLGAPLGALLGALAAVAAAQPGQWGAVAFAAGQSLYLAAATVLLVLEREKELFGALLPLAAGALVALWTPLPTAARVALLLLSLLAALGLATRALAGETTPGAPGRQTGGGLAVPRLTASLPYGLFGLGTGLLVLYTAFGDALAYGPAAAVPGAGTGSTGAAGTAPDFAAAVALTLSMGPAEWLLHRFRSESLAGLRAARSPGAFRRAAGGTLALCLAGYLTVLLLLTAAGTALMPGAPPPGGVRLVALLLIGAVLWTALLLQSFGAVLWAAAVCLTAAGARTLLLATGAGDARMAGAVVAGAAAGALGVLCCVLLGRATAHRY